MIVLALGRGEKLRRENVEDYFRWGRAACGTAMREGDSTNQDLVLSQLCAIIPDIAKARPAAICLIFCFGTSL